MASAREAGGRGQGDSSVQCKGQVSLDEGEGAGRRNLWLQDLLTFTGTVVGVGGRGRNCVAAEAGWG